MYIDVEDLVQFAGGNSVQKRDWRNGLKATLVESGKLSGQLFQELPPDQKSCDTCTWTQAPAWPSIP
jgi:hypothetical protein